MCMHYHALAAAHCLFASVLQAASSILHFLDLNVGIYHAVFNYVVG